MKHRIEKLKTQLLLTLVILSLVQLGIHWNQQAQGFLSRFVGSIFGRSDFPTTNVEKSKFLYFMPEDVTVTVGLANSRWKFSQDDFYYTKIWEDMKSNYLPAMIKMKPDKVLPKGQWTSVIAQSCIIINFNVNWPNDIIYWLEDVNPGDNRSFESIKSIAIVPQLDVNETVNILYIYDEKQVYQYKVDIGNDFLPKKFYSEMAATLRFQERPSLSLLTSVTNFKASEEILVSLERGMTEFPTLQLKIPEVIRLNRENIESESIQDHILLDQKVSLMAKYNQASGEAWFTDTENLYRLYSNGMLQYNYLPSTNRDAGAASSAFSQALSFIELRRHLLGDVDLVLSDITSHEQYYEMHFTYQIGGIPIHYGGSKESDRISAPLIIKANADRVIDCVWVIRSITRTGQSKDYSLYFPEIPIPLAYLSDFQKGSNLFKRIESGYLFDLNQTGATTLSPLWIISNTDKDYAFPLSAKED